jgi:hypothetical protein
MKTKKSKSDWLSIIAVFFGFLLWDLWILWVLLQIIIMGVSGGAIILPLQGIINDHFGFFISLSLLFICLVLIFIFTLKLDKNVQ